MAIQSGALVGDTGGVTGPPLPDAGWSADVSFDGASTYVKGFWQNHSAGPQTINYRVAMWFDLSSIAFRASEQVLTATFGCYVNSTTGAGSSEWSILSYSTTGDETSPEADTAANMYARCTGGNALTAANTTAFRTTGAKSIALNATALTDINNCINTGSKKFAIAIKMVTETGPNTWSGIRAWNNTNDTPPTLTLGIGVPASNIPPVSNAGPNQSVTAGATVTLDGTGSTDADGTISTYAWTQTAGTTVTLSSTSSSQPTFTAPQVLTQTVLTFQLEVTDNSAGTNTDTVNITVTPGSSGSSTPIVNTELTDVTSADLDTLYESNEIQVSGIGTGTTGTIGIVGGTYSLNGAAYTSAPGLVRENDTVKVRVRSSPLYGTTVSAHLYINGVEVG